MSDPIEKRRLAIREWLRETAPDIGEEQKHLDQGTTECAYWHYGYLMALEDIKRLCDQPKN